MSEKLLPCPHCGGKEHEIGVGDAGYSITCHSFSCRSSTGLWHTREQAIAAWNRRPSPSQVAPDAGVFDAAIAKIGRNPLWTEMQNGAVDEILRRLRASPSQVAPQPQAGEAVWAAGAKAIVRETHASIYASPQPANPAQVTEADRKAVERGEASIAEFNRLHSTAAIGAGGQAVALRQAAEEFCRRVEAGEIRSKKSYAAFKSALSQPHPADERVVEAMELAEEAEKTAVFWGAEANKAMLQGDHDEAKRCLARAKRHSILAVRLRAKEGRNNG